MAKISTSVSLDADVKAKAQELFADLGLDLSTAINVFLKQSLYEHGFPFPIRRDRPNEITLAAMDDAESGNNLSGPFDTVSAMMEDLNA